MKRSTVLTGTVLVRKIDYGKSGDAPPEGSVPFPLLILDQPICTWGPDDESEFLQWALHVADKCARVWPTVSRVKVTGTLHHAFNWHHHSLEKEAQEPVPPVSRHERVRKGHRHAAMRSRLR
jgi:hypothetical protein